MQETPLITGPSGPINTSGSLIITPETDLILPQGARKVVLAQPDHSAALLELRHHPLVTAPIVFAGQRTGKDARSLSEKAKNLPGRNRKQKRQRAKAIR